MARVAGPSAWAAPGVPRAACSAGADARVVGRNDAVRHEHALDHVVDHGGERPVAQRTDTTVPPG